MRNIFIISIQPYTVESVGAILRTQNLKHNFVFGSKFDISEEQAWQDFMHKCDEVWVYGKPNRTFDIGKWQHSYALGEGMEIWNMG